MLNSHFFAQNFYRKSIARSHLGSFWKQNLDSSWKPALPQSGWLLFEPQEQVFRRGDHFLTCSGRIFCWKEKQEQLWAAGSHKSFHFCANEQLLCPAQPTFVPACNCFTSFVRKIGPNFQKWDVAPSLDKRAIGNSGCNLLVCDLKNKGGWLS